MEFSDRLRLMIEEEGLSPSDFADDIGVNRSGISHLLNGRNKPGYDFLKKMRAQFPSWDIDWLLFGGKRDKQSNSGRRHTKEEKKSIPKEEERKEVSQQRQTTTAQAHQAELFNEESSYEQSLSKTTENQGAVKFQKTVVRTILVYNDGTFEIFTNKSL